MPLIIVAEAAPGYALDPECAWVVETVDAWLGKTEKRRHDPGRFHPSDLILTDEEIIARFNGTVVARDGDFDPKKLRVFDNGHGMHNRWSRYFRQSGLSTKHKKGFWMPRLRLSGTCDEIVQHPETDKTYIVELKSINPFAFTKLTEPSEGHVDQLHCYMAGLRIVDGMVLYECKGTQAVKVFPCAFDAARWRLIEERLLRLRREAEARPRWEDNQPPEVVEAARALKAELDGLPEDDIRRRLTARRVRLVE